MTKKRYRLPSHEVVFVGRCMMSPSHHYVIVSVRDYLRPHYNYVAHLCPHTLEMTFYPGIRAGCRNWDTFAAARRHYTKTNFKPRMLKIYPHHTEGERWGIRRANAGKESIRTRALARLNYMEKICKDLKSGKRKPPR